MTNEAATKMTAEIVVATIEHMADSENVSFATVVDLIASGHANTVKRFNDYMMIATKACA